MFNVLTIAGEYGSGGSEIGRKVAELLGWECLDKQIIERAATRYARFGRLPDAIAGDFPALGKPYRDLSSDEFAILSSIAQERHRALNWVCGESPTGRWEDTRTDT